MTTQNDTPVSEKRLRQVLTEFSKAWDRGDVDALIQMMTDDCIYGASVGPDPGMTYVGQEDVRRGFEQMLKHDSEGESKSGRVLIMNNIARVEASCIYGSDLYFSNSSEQFLIIPSIASRVNLK